MKKYVELLAPAGSWDCMVAAANAGCDAVYMGGSKFGARAYAENAEQDAVLRAIDWMHVRGKKLYLTVNTLLKEREIEQQFVDFLKPFYLQGLDAVIVQDVGVIKLLSEVMPELPIHLSTQMTLNTAEAAEAIRRFCGKNHITRFVPSRELSLDEIRLMKSKTSLELETFIHGALCYCYSGQCLMSSLIGGRSGNRGRCAQPCRLPYRYQPETTDEKSTEQYILSPKDICTLEMLPELIQAGINSFKIEGRMKGTGYVSGVTEGYRRCLDLYYEKGDLDYREYILNHPEFLHEINDRFLELYNRGSFSHGFYDCSGGKSMMAIRRPNHNGVLVGTVKQIRGINAGILLERDVQAQDICEIRDGEECIYEFTVGTGEKAGNLYCTNFKPGSPVRCDAKVYRTRNQSLLNELDDKYLHGNVPVPISGKFQMVSGKPMELSVSLATGGKNNRFCALVKGEPAEEAKKQPMTEEKLREKLMKTGETPFIFTSLEILTDNHSFCPVGKLNELRRSALTQLEEAIAGAYRRVISQNCHETDAGQTGNIQQISSKEPENEKNEPYVHPRIQVLVTTEEQLRKVCGMPDPDDVYVDITDLPKEKWNDYFEMVQSAGKDCYVALPRILRESGLRELEKYQGALFNPSVEGYLLRNLDAYSLIYEQFHSDRQSMLCGKSFITDYNLYCMNHYAREFWNCGANRMTAPLELTGEELRELSVKEMILPVYGQIPMMVTGQCPNRVFGKCKKGGENRESVLTDRMNKELPVMAHCDFCFTTIHNSDVYSLAGLGKDIIAMKPYAVRIDLLLENSQETERVIRTFSDEIRFRMAPRRDFLYHQTKGNYIRGVE